jgi:hypothetical protein
MAAYASPLTPLPAPHPPSTRPLQSYVPIPVPQYLSSEWSFAQYRVPPPPPAGAARQPQPGGGAAAAPQQPGASGGGGGSEQQYQGPGSQHSPGKIIVGFSPAELHTLIVVTQAGGYHKVSFDPVKGGPCTQVASHSFASWLHGADGDGGELGGEAVLV